eukprot:6208900-Pleurochrysis_carterae.AAC.1
MAVVLRIRGQQYESEYGAPTQPVATSKSVEVGKVLEKISIQMPAECQECSPDDFAGGEDSGNQDCNNLAAIATTPEGKEKSSKNAFEAHTTKKGNTIVRASNSSHMATLNCLGS